MKRGSTLDKGDDGKPVERPSIQEINKATGAYWQQRAEATTNLLLQARYAGLVWELSEAAIGEKTIARLYCDALFDVRLVYSEKSSNDEEDAHLCAGKSGREAWPLLEVAGPDLQSCVLV